MDIKISGCGVTRTGLTIGLRIEYSENGPIRFASVVIDDDALGWQDLTALAAFLDRQYRRHMDREREVDPDQVLPGL